MELFDELYSGVPSVGAAEIHRELALSYGATLQVLFLLPGLVALVFEPLIFLLADRYPRKWFVCGGLLAMSVAAFVAAAADHVALFALALVFAYLGSGAGVVLAQATLVDAAPEGRERVLARWTLLGEVGDLGAPLLLAGLSVLGLGFRTGYVVVGALLLGWTAWLATRRFPDEEEDEDTDEPEPTLRESFLVAVRNRPLLVWLAATALCDLLDEVVVVFGALHLEATLGMGPVARGAVFGAGVVGAIVGAALTERLLARWDAMPLLALAGVACLGCFGAWLFVDGVLASSVLFGLVGLTAAPMYPLAMARAYAALPGRSGAVNAAGHLFTPLALGLPWLLGLLADASDLRIALLVLAVQPLGIALLAAATWIRERRAARTDAR